MWVLTPSLTLPRYGSWEVHQHGAQCTRNSGHLPPSAKDIALLVHLRKRDGPSPE